MYRVSIDVTVRAHCNSGARGRLVALLAGVLILSSCSSEDVPQDISRRAMMDPPIGGVWIAPDQQTLRIVVVGSDCSDDYSVTAEDVKVGLKLVVTYKEKRACLGVGMKLQVPYKLESPLGKRVIVGESEKPLQIFDSQPTFSQAPVVVD